MSFELLPRRLVYNVEEFLDGKDVASVSALSKKYRKVNSDEDSSIFWKGLYVRKMRKNDPFFEQRNGMVDFRQASTNAFLIQYGISRFNFDGRARLTDISGIATNKDGRFFTVAFRAALKDIDGNNWGECEVYNNRRNIHKIQNSSDIYLHSQSQNETQTVVWIKDCRKPRYSAMVTAPDDSIAAKVNRVKENWTDHFDWCSPGARQTCKEVIILEAAMLLWTGVIATAFFFAKNLD